MYPVAEVSPAEFIQLYASWSDPVHPVARKAEGLLATIPKPRVVQTRRGPITCVIEGEGRPLLALHGIMGGFDQSWLLARALLGRGEGWQIIAIARPGYEGTPLETGATADEQAEAYAALLETLDLGPVHVAAFSGGGPSALAFARLYPERCRGLVLVSACTGRLDTSSVKRACLAQMGSLVGLPGIESVPAWMVRQWPQVAACSFVPDPQQRREVFVDPDGGPLLTAFLLSSCVHMAKRMPGTLNDIAEFTALPPGCGAGLKVPMLVAHGTADGIVPFAHAAGLVHRAPGARLLSLPDASHMAIFTFLAIVREMVASLLENAA